MLLSVAALTCVLSTSSTHDLIEARAAEADLDYQRAKILLEGVLNTPDLPERERLEAHFLAGQIERVLGNDTEARLHFLAVLTAEPQWTLADDTPPKIRTFFEMVRAEVKDVRRVQEKPAPTTPPAVPTATPPGPPVASGPPLLGVVVTAGGAALIAVGVSAGIAGEWMFAQTDALFENRASGRTLALAGWAGSAVGAIVGVVGAATLLTQGPSSEGEPQAGGVKQAMASPPTR
jgi:hypothetical protein